MDIFGSFSLMAMLVSSLLGFQLLGDEGMSPLVSALLLCSIVLLGVFIFAEKELKILSS